MERGDDLVVSGEWLRSWWTWPREWKEADVRDEAAAWSCETLMCRCSRPAFLALSLSQRRELVAVFAGVLRDGVSRSFLLPDGRRAFTFTELCDRRGGCPERRFRRMVLSWSSS